MKTLFKNRTKYSKEVYEQFLQFHQNKFGIRYKFYTIIILILIFFCISMQVKTHNYDLAIIFCIAFSIFFLWRFLHPIDEVKKELQSDKIVKEKEFSFVFFEDCFEVHEKRNYEKFKYYKLYRFYETENFFYLYIDKNHAFLLDKGNFLIGDCSDFARFIKRKKNFFFKFF